MTTHRSSAKQTYRGIEIVRGKAFDLGKGTVSVTTEAGTTIYMSYRDAAAAIDAMLDGLA